MKSLNKKVKAIIWKISQDRNIRLILRNSDRYKDYLRQLINRNEMSEFTSQFISNLKRAFKEINCSSYIAFCCLDTGYYHGIVITDDSCFVSNRKSDKSHIEGGCMLKDSEYVRQEIERFDRVFDANFRGHMQEIKAAETFILSLRQ